MSNNNRLTDLLGEADRIAILHHWDADGISSATQIIEWARARNIECINRTPPIGNYTDYTSQIRKLARRKPNIILGLDLASTKAAMRDMAASVSTKLAWVDHHSNPPDPPEQIAFYHPANTESEEVMYSNSWFLSSLLGNLPGLPAAIGMCGDLGHRLRSIPIHQAIARITSAHGITIQELFTITDLIDSNYRADSKREVEDAPWTLVENLQRPRQLLEIQTWQANKEAVDQELERLMAASSKQRGNILIKTINTKMHLTSIVARKASLANHGDIKAVIVQNLERENTPFYIRRTRSDLDLTPLIDLGRSQGYSAGGKPEVVGMIIPRNHIPDITERVIEYLEKSR